MESIEKLRELATGSHSYLSNNRVLEMVDEIEREIESSYMKLPLDADGLPIHVGDKVKCKFNDDVREVGYVGKCGFHEETHHYFDAENFTHVKPDPVKELLIEFAREYVEARGFANESYENMRKCGIADEYAERIREAVEK